MKVAITRLHSDAKHPLYQTEYAAGMDVVACIDEPVTIAPHERAVIPTGFAIALPPGYEADSRAKWNGGKVWHHARQWRGYNRR